MITFASTQVAKEDMAVFERIRHCVNRLPDHLDLGKDEKEDSIELSCFMLARAVGTVFLLEYVDGSFLNIFEHSWIQTRNGNIIDVYPVGIIGGPILVDGGAMGPARHLYRSLSKTDLKSKKNDLNKQWFTKATKIVANHIKILSHAIG